MGTDDPRHEPVRPGDGSRPGTVRSPPPISLPTLGVPTGGGAIRSIGEKLAANPATGAAQLSVPVATPKGRAGFELGLSVRYGSDAGNGPFGVGWQLSVPSITRKTDKGLPRYADDTESDIYVLLGAEDLVPIPGVVDGGDHLIRRYRPRVEGDFSRIERWTLRTTGEVHWRTVTSDNVSSIFGESAEARVADPDDGRRVFSWLLEQTRDDRGNIIRYVYKGEDGAGVDPGQCSETHRFDRDATGKLVFRRSPQRYLKRIRYGNRRPNVAGDWLFEVVLDYGEHDAAAPTPDEVTPWPVRDDPLSSYRSGFEVRTYRLCRRVLAFHRIPALGASPTLVRSTDFDYQEQGHLTRLRRITQAGYQREGGGYRRATLPPIDLSYIDRVVRDQVGRVDAQSLLGIPAGVDGTSARWADLDGEGIQGVLIAGDQHWRYKPNLGGGKLAAPALLRTLPAPAQLQGGMQQLVDLDGDGRLDLVQYAAPLAGYFTRTQDGTFTPFAGFRSIPNVDWRDPNLRFIDLDGDGLPDLLVTENDALIWYRSRGKDGFDPGQALSRPKDERRGAAVIFADGTETIQLADMTGDGLVDIVRVRNGEICYWPNQGYGRFGRKVTMDGAPRLAAPAEFDPRRVRWADLDGSGTADLVYLGGGGVQLFFNESGNGFSRGETLSLPLPHSLADVQILDLLGNGTACVVWSSGAPAPSVRPVFFVDLFGGDKPHLLAAFSNNLGAEVQLSYASSTRFYLEDKAAGRPWLTRLPFPVRVLERIERRDRITGDVLVSRYRYRHGFYDGVEREFRGFAFVEQRDAESAGPAPPGNPGAGSPGAADSELVLPPVLIKTWFHTGAWLERERLERGLAREYYRGDPAAPLLPDTLLPPGLTTIEEREAARALRGRILRQEVYSDDGTPESPHPFAVSERDYTVRVLQRIGPAPHAVFFVHAREQIDQHYERRASDPRVEHQLVLDVDEFGHVTRAASAAYPRRTPADPEQARLLATVTERSFVNHADATAFYRLGVPIEGTTLEITGLSGLQTVEGLRAALALAPRVSFEVVPPPSGVALRLVSRARHTYYRDDLSGALPFGEVESLALPFESRGQAFTPGLLAQAYGDRVDAALLAEAGYSVEDGAIWAPSGRFIYAPEAFFLPVEAIDPFGNRAFARYDDLALLLFETEDAAGNKTTAGDRDQDGHGLPNGLDYRVLAPTLLTDPNLNQSAVRYDELAMPVAIALMGKAGAGEGDTLDDPTRRFVYDLHRFATSGGRQPVFTHSFARERHGPDNPRFQEAYSYADGFGREIMKKVQAEPGPVPARGPDGRLLRDAGGAVLIRQEDQRWIGTGRTVFDNKGNPVKKYQPFFSDTFEFESESEIVQSGVTPVFRYDPLSRLVRVDLPDGTLRRIEIDAWLTVTSDENDTVLESRWFAERGAPDPAGPEPRDDPARRAAWLAAQHAGTPTRAHLDPLGRTFLSETDNQDRSGFLQTRVELDISGNRVTVVDARGIRTVDHEIFDLRGQRLLARCPDVGESRTLTDVVGRPVRAWRPRGDVVRQSYDLLRRPTLVFLRRPDAAAEMVVERVSYGEDLADATARNLRGRAHLSFDGAGLTSSEQYDFKGNLVAATRRLARAYRDVPDWTLLPVPATDAALEQAAEPVLEAERFASFTAYDALDRVVSRLTPDGSEALPTYNQANLLERLQVRVRGATEATTYVADIDYDARGQRTRLVHGNGVVCDYAYDPQTFRLARVTDTRPNGERLQDLAYEYDPVGNVVQVTDGVSFGNPAVRADGLYRYDAIYRLTSAEGREHPGQQPTAADAPLVDLGHPHDLQRLQRYRESYTYDRTGNILAMRHQPLAPASSAWVRRYQYDGGSNRLLRTSGPGDQEGVLSDSYQYDAAGNMVAMPHLRTLRWDHADRLLAADLGGGGNVFFSYDAKGMRSRKVLERAGGWIEERIYLGSFEIYRTRRAALDLERQTLHVLDGPRHVALLESKTVDRSLPAFTPVTRTRYQLENHLGSSVLEVDEGAQVISYEEYFAYGGTAFRASRGSVEVSDKRYRYTGKERDEETGLYYHGARYYADWLGRWTSADPAGTADGLDRYAYVQDNPLRFTDPGGAEGHYDETNGLCLAEPLVSANAAVTSSLPAGYQFLASPTTENVLIPAVELPSSDVLVRASGTPQPASGSPVASHVRVDPDPLVSGFQPTNPGKVATPAEHALGNLSKVVTEVEGGTTYSYVVQDSPYIAASSNIEKAAFGNYSFEGELSLIDVTKLPPETQVVRNPEVIQSVQEYATANPSQSSRASTYIANQPVEQENLIKGSVPAEAITPLSEARTTLTAEITVAPSATSRALATAGNVALEGLRFAGKALTVYGAHTVAERNANEFGGSGVVYAGTFLWAVAAGVVDDAFAAATVEIGSAPVLDSWERNGAGPAQVAVADALSAYYHWSASVGF